MDYLQAFILSVVEGVTEFLPISSTGHLILFSKLLNIEQSEFAKSFEIIIQLGAILAVCFLYKDKILSNIKIWRKILIAFIPTGILGFIFYKIVKHFLLGNVYATLYSLLFGGIVLIVLELLHQEKEHHAEKIENIPDKNAFLIGVAQSVAMIPGVSRAAATIIGALLLGTKRTAAVEFSFLLAIPTMFAATLLDVAKSSFAFSSNEYILLAIGFFGSFFVAILAVKFFLQFIQKNTFIPFGIYRIILAILFFLLMVK